MTPAISVLLWVSIGVGAVAAITALYGRYCPLPGFMTGPNICRLEEKGCQVLFRTRNAALLGVPNSLLGLCFYGFLSVGLLARWPASILLGAGTLAFAMSVYLAFLLLKNRLECRICWLGHAANTALLLSLAVAFLRDRVT